MFSYPVSLDTSRRELSTGIESPRSHASFICRLADWFFVGTRHPVLSEHEFEAGLRLEQRRMERSGRSFLVVRIQAPEIFSSEGHSRGKCALRLFASMARQTDLVGWVEQGKVLGVICTELGSYDEASAGSVILEKMKTLAAAHLAPALVAGLSLSLDVYASNSDQATFESLRIAQLVP